MKSDTEVNQSLPTRFTLYTERFLGCIVLSLFDAVIIKCPLFILLAYTGVVSTILDTNFSSIFAVMMILNWWFGLKELRESRKILMVINHNVGQIMNMTAIMVVKNSIQTLSNAFMSSIDSLNEKKPDLDDDNNVDK